MKHLYTIALVLCSTALQAQSTEKAVDKTKILSEDCALVVEGINDQAKEKFIQADSARIHHPEMLEELRALYSIARDAWNEKAHWIEKNGPGYSRGLGPSNGDGSSFTTSDLSAETKRFFTLLRDASYEGAIPTSGHDIVAAVAIEEEGQLMPYADRWLRRLRNQCREEEKQVMDALHVIRLPASFEDL